GSTPPLPPSRPKPDCLKPPERDLVSVAGRIVDADQPVLEALGQAQRSSEVTCVHVGAEAVGRGVGRVSSRATAISSVASSSTVGTQKKPRDQTPSVSGWPHDAAPGCRGRRGL